MERLRILVTGDYWNEEFREELAQIQWPLTMVPADKIPSVVETPFDLAIIVQSHRDSSLQSTVDQLRGGSPSMPIVTLLGAWTEGETRSGEPLVGATRVYVHQWRSRFDRFVQQLSSGGVTGWHQPTTSNDADHLRLSPAITTGRDFTVAIVANDRPSYESLADAVHSMGSAAIDVRPGEKIAAAEQGDMVFCIDANSMDERVEEQISAIGLIADRPAIVVLLSFPRQQDVRYLARLGVQQIVSKPYLVNDLGAALVAAHQLRQQRSDAAHSDTRPPSLGKPRSSSTKSRVEN